MTIKEERDNYKKLYEEMSRRLGQVRSVANSLRGPDIFNRHIKSNSIGEKLIKICFGQQKDG